MWSAIPAPQGLYHPEHEKDACGVAFVAQLSGEKSHARRRAGASRPCENLEHRGASGAEPDSGDGAGILTQVPDAFFRAVLAEQGVDLPPRRSLRRRHRVPARRRRGRARGDAARSRRSPPRRASTVLGWRDLPVDPTGVGATARSVMPRFEQLFVHAPRPARHGHGARADGVLPAQARRARGRRLLPVAVAAHHRLQGHAHHRRSSRRSSPT